MSTTTKKLPHQYLGLTKQQYFFDCFSQYTRWCLNLEKNHKVPLQCLLANRALCNYYDAQFLELEHSFLVIAEKLDGLVDYEMMLKNYEMIMVELYTNYPMALIEDAKKIKIENSPYSN